MKDYIERNDAKTAFCRHMGFTSVRISVAADAIFDNIPAADAVEVVRCPECVHHVDCGYHFCNMWCANCPDDSDFFCAYGERDGGVNDGRT